MSTKTFTTTSLVVILIVAISGLAGGYVIGSGKEPTDLSEEERNQLLAQWQTEQDAMIHESKTLRIGVDNLHISYDPAACTATDLQQFILTGVYDTLIRTRGYDTGTFYPNLADSWEISADGLKYTFHIKPGVKFVSGHEVTAEAVVYTLWRTMLLNLEPAWLFRQCINYNVTDSVKALDKYTVQFTLMNRFPPFMTLLASMTGVVMDPAEVDSQGGQLSEDSVEFFAEHSAGAGSGPYILDHWTRGVELVLKRNTDYWGGQDGVQPWFDNIVFLEIGEAADLEMMLEAGDIDMAYGTTPDMWDNWETSSDIDLFPIDPARYYYMGMNCYDEESPFRELKVRQAVKCAIYREDYLTVEGDYGRLQGGPIVYGYPGYDEDLLRGPYTSDGNIAKAKQLLSESSYPNGFQTELLVSEGSVRELMAPIVKAQLAEIGIDVEIRVYAKATALAMYRRAEYTGMVMWSWGIDYPDPQNLADIHMKIGGTLNKRVAYTTEIHPSLAESDDLCTQAMQTEDSSLRDTLYRQAQMIDHEYGPWVYFFGSMWMRPRRCEVHGGLPINPLYGWEIKYLWKEIEP